MFSSRVGSSAKKKRERKKKRLAERLARDRAQSARNATNSPSSANQYGIPETQSAALPRRPDDSPPSPDSPNFTAPQPLTPPLQPSSRTTHSTYVYNQQQADALAKNLLTDAGMTDEIKQPVLLLQREEKEENDVMPSRCGVIILPLASLYLAGPEIAEMLQGLNLKAEHNQKLVGINVNEDNKLAFQIFLGAHFAVILVKYFEPFIEEAIEIIKHYHKHRRKPDHWPELSPTREAIAWGASAIITFVNSTNRFLGFYYFFKELLYDDNYVPIPFAILYTGLNFVTLGPNVLKETRELLAPSNNDEKSNCCVRGLSITFAAVIAFSELAQAYYIIDELDLGFGKWALIPASVSAKGDWFLLFQAFEEALKETIEKLRAGPVERIKIGLNIALCIFIADALRGMLSFSYPETLQSIFDVDKENPSPEFIFACNLLAYKTAALMTYNFSLMHQPITDGLADLVSWLKEKCCCSTSRIMSVFSRANPELKEDAAGAYQAAAEDEPLPVIARLSIQANDDSPRSRSFSVNEASRVKTESFPRTLSMPARVSERSALLNNSSLAAGANQSVMELTPRTPASGMSFKRFPTERV